MMMFSPLSQLLLSVFAASCLAEKDSDYYFPGFTSPLVNHPMYWKDSVNVLQDLDQFEALYIRYHGCVWSKFGSRYGSGQNYDEQGANEDDQVDGDYNSYNNGCGGWGGEHFWYMGRTQCFKANAAYSLYGVLKDQTETVTDRKGNYCHKGTFINSFFTTFGAESFAGPLGLGVDTANSFCHMMEGEGAKRRLEEEEEEDGDDFEKAKADDDYLDDEYQFYNWKAYVSYGTGCSAEGKFVTDMYQGAFCKGHNYFDTIETLDSFNEELEKIDCLQIYDGSSYYNQGDRARKLEEQGQYDFDDMDPLDILSFSKTCSLAQYPDECPDPYKLKAMYRREINHALGFLTGDDRNAGYKAVKALTWIGFSGGFLFVIAALILRRVRAEKPPGKKTRRKKHIAPSPPSIDKDPPVLVKDVVKEGDADPPQGNTVVAPSKSPNDNNEVSWARTITSALETTRVTEQPAEKKDISAEKRSSSVEKKVASDKKKNTSDEKKITEAEEKNTSAEAEKKKALAEAEKTKASVEAEKKKASAEAEKKKASAEKNKAATGKKNTSENRKVASPGRWFSRMNLSLGGSKRNASPPKAMSFGRRNSAQKNLTQTKNTAAARGGDKKNNPDALADVIAKNDLGKQESRIAWQVVQQKDLSLGGNKRNASPPKTMSFGRRSSA